MEQAGEASEKFPCGPAAVQCPMSVDRRSKCLGVSRSERQMQPKRVIDLKHEGGRYATESLPDSVN